MVNNPLASKKKTSGNICRRWSFFSLASKSDAADPITRQRRSKPRRSKRLRTWRRRKQRRSSLQRRKQLLQRLRMQRQQLLQRLLQPTSRRARPRVGFAGGFFSRSRARSGGDGEAAGDSKHRSKVGLFHGIRSPHLGPKKFRTRDYPPSCRTTPRITARLWQS